jgi:glycopeptide antibiotics resistance protein
MITDVLVEHPWLSPLALALMVLLGPLVGRSLLTRPRLTWLLTGLSLLPVVLLTLIPVDGALVARCAIQWALPTPGRVELMANVVLFVAPVLLAGLATRRPVLMLLAGSGLSAIVEVFQAVVTAIGRSCDTNDWLSNTIGSAIGAGLAILTLRWTSAR